MIRSANDSDAEAIAGLYNHYVENSIATFETEPVSGADMSERVALVQRLGLPWLVIEADGQVCGYACAVRWKQRTAYRHSVESTIYMAHDSVGRGLGVPLYSELMRQLEPLGVHAVLAGIALPNEASVGLHEKLGFAKVAHMREVGRKFDRWIDVGYWQRVEDSLPGGGATS